MESTSVIQQKGLPKDYLVHVKEGFPCITEVGRNPLIPNPALGFLGKIDDLLSLSERVLPVCRPGDCLNLLPGLT